MPDLHSRVVLCEAVDWFICFTRKIQHGGDWEHSRPQGPKNVHNFLMTVRPLSWAGGHGTEMLLILKKIFLTCLCPDIFRYDSPKKCPTILYAVNLWLKPVLATYSSRPLFCAIKTSWNCVVPSTPRRRSAQTQNNSPMLAWRWSSLCDAGTTSKKHGLLMSGTDVPYLSQWAYPWTETFLRDHRLLMIHFTCDTKTCRRKEVQNNNSLLDDKLRLFIVAD